MRSHGEIPDFDDSGTIPMFEALPLGHLTAAVFVPLLVGLASSYWRHGEVADPEGILLGAAGAAAVYGIPEFGGPLAVGQQYAFVAALGFVLVTLEVLRDRSTIDESD